MNQFKSVVVLLAVSTIGLSVSASAAVTTYTDRTSWLASAGTPTFVENFESFKTDTSFASAPLALASFTLSTTGTAPSNTEKVDTSPFTFSGVPSSFGNAYLDAFVQPGLTVSMTFDAPVSALFADFLWAGNGTQLTLQLNFVDGSASNIQVPGVGTDLVPFGFISSGPKIKSIIFENSVNDGFGVDNIAGVSAVPEPQSYALMFAGAGLIAAVAKRKSKAQPIWG